MRLNRTTAKAAMRSHANRVGIAQRDGFEEESAHSSPLEDGFCDHCPDSRTGRSRATIVMIGTNAGRTT